MTTLRQAAANQDDKRRPWLGQAQPTVVCVRVFERSLSVYTDLQSISERVRSARAFLLVERMVCLTSESGCHKKSKEGDFSLFTTFKKSGFNMLSEYR